LLNRTEQGDLEDPENNIEDIKENNEVFGIGSKYKSKVYENDGEKHHKKSSRNRNKSDSDDSGRRI